MKKILERQAEIAEARRLHARGLVMRAGLVAWRRYVDEASRLLAEGIERNEVIELLQNKFGKAA